MDSGLTTDPPRRPARLAVALIGALVAWVGVYRLLDPVSRFLVTGVLRIPEKSGLGYSVGLFVYQAPRMLMVLMLVVFGVGIIRSFFAPERIRLALAGRSEVTGSVLASLLGIVTPFCNCSAVPLFIGFLEAGVPLGVTFSFLIAAPMVNEIAVAMLLGLFGPKVAGLYVGTGLAIAIASGLVISRLKMERYIEDWVSAIRTSHPVGPEAPTTWDGRILLGWKAVGEALRRVWPYVISGMGVGALVHGYVPAGVMSTIAGRNSWWSVPAAVLIGVPMYSNPAGIIPVVQALLEKGAAMGTVLAFMMSVIGLSLPEIIVLRRVLKPRLIAVFVGVVALGVLLVGLIFNAVGL